MNRTAEAVALLRQELEQTPAILESTKRAARLLAFDFAKHFFMLCHGVLLHYIDWKEDRLISLPFNDVAADI